MIRKKLLNLCLLGFMTFGFVPPKPKTPNIVLIFMDDLGYGDIGANGATNYQTPNIDKMASEGIRFTNFLAAQAVCSASRAPC
jgi:arylsulfatase